MKLLPFLLLPMLVLTASTAGAATVKDRAGAVLNDRAAMEKDPRWIYNDFERGFKLAASRGKPLLVVLRCVPCLACAGIDASVLSDPELVPLLDQFVCVRLINANTLDLSRFQFDYDLSFSTLFFNGDGTVYGRYGSWTHQKNAYDKTIAGYKTAMEGALALHRGYPGNKDTLTGKQGTPIPFKNPLEIPELAGKYKRELDWQGKVVQSCVHCHQVGDAVRSFYREARKPIPSEWVYPLPTPETVGLTLAPDHAARIQAVEVDSPAAQAGFLAGDDIVSLSGQPLVSTADVSWALHRAPDRGTLPALVRRGAGQKQIDLVLPEDWRYRGDISRRVGTWTLRAMATGGLLLEELTDEERTSRQLGPKDMALLVKHAGEYGKHAAAKKAGFQKADVIVELDGRSRRISESELIGRLLRDHQPGESVQAKVLREGKKIDLLLPIQ